MKETFAPHNTKWQSSAAIYAKLGILALKGITYKLDEEREATSAYAVT